MTYGLMSRIRAATAPSESESVDTRRLDIVASSRVSSMLNRPLLRPLLSHKQFGSQNALPAPAFQGTRTFRGVKIVWHENSDL